MLNADDLLNNLRRDPQFTTVVLGAIDKDGDPLWGFMYSLEALEAEKMSYTANGELTSFYLEYHNQVRNDESATFKDNFVYQIMLRTEFVAVALACDPAISDKKKSDYFALAVVGQTEKGQKHLLDAWGGKGIHPATQVNKFFELHTTWDCNLHGVEATAYQAALISLIKQDMFIRAKELGPKAYFDITPILYRTEKKARIKGVLAPLYRSGYITHQRRFPELETQLLDFPNGPDDFPDVVAMAIQLLDPYAALAGDLENLAGNSMPPLDDFLPAFGGVP